MPDLKKFNDDFCMICKDKECIQNTSFKLLLDGNVKCDSCGAIYGFVRLLGEWVKIVKKPKTKNKKT